MTDLLPLSGTVPGFTGILKAEGIPAKVNGPFLETHGVALPLVDDSGVFVRVIHFPPAGEGEDKVNINHRTQSVDVGVVLSGEIQMTLDDDIKSMLKAGDVVVQRGTMHVRFSLFFYLLGDIHI
jgi:quercetin dioxygenase-like cupin family protein